MNAPLAGVVPGIIDSHIHQWDPFTTPREASRLAPLYRRAPRLLDALFPVLVAKGARDMVLSPQHVARPYLPDTYAADVSGVESAVGAPVEAILHVEAGWHSDDPSEETAWVASLPFGEGGAPRLAGIVAHADPRSDDFTRTLDAHAQVSDRFVGIRCMAAWHEDKKVMRWGDREGILRSREFLDGFAPVADRGLTFDAYVYSTQLSDVTVLAEEYPDTTIILDHYGPPVGWLGPMGRSLGRTEADRTELFARWKDGIAAVAEHPNVVAKHSGIGFPMTGLQQVGIGRSELADLVAPMVDHATDVFGEDRLLFGSNFPMDKAVVDYATLVGAMADILAPRGPELLRKVFRANAERVYGA
jgi:L-fuconolactonase